MRGVVGGLLAVLVAVVVGKVIDVSDPGFSFMGRYHEMEGAIEYDWSAFEIRFMVTGTRACVSRPSLFHVGAN